jgi:alpha-N-acetylglucosamine transferase
MSANKSRGQYNPTVLGIYSLVKMAGLAVNPLEYKDSAPPGSKCAWVVFLLSSPSYLPGILVLGHSLKKYKSKYPLIVAVNPKLPQETKDALVEAGYEVRTVKPLIPLGKVTTIAERFVDTWTKLALFEFVEYDVCVYAVSQTL